MFAPLLLRSWRRGRKRADAPRSTTVAVRYSTILGQPLEELRYRQRGSQYQVGRDDQDDKGDEVDCKGSYIGPAHVVGLMPAFGRGEDGPFDHPEEVTSGDERDQDRN